ncbi:hypothetical protein NKG95_29140 [Mesorhizobium sp. M1423]|uniref:hypothetical protein n=1 Tax=Mesorhizobium sp. M1423 TaxID=2957101 RepID=UPI0033375045
MRSGDIITSRRGHKWIIGYPVEEGAYERALGKGRHYFLIRAIDWNGTPNLLFTLRPQCDIRKGWQRNDFEVGYSSAGYLNGSVSLVRQDTLYFAVPATADVHPFTEVHDGKMLVKAASGFNDLFVAVQYDSDGGGSDHLILWRWQFALLMQRDREGKAPIDFSQVQGRIARPEEI